MYILLAKLIVIIKVPSPLQEIVSIQTLSINTKILLIKRFFTSTNHSNLIHPSAQKEHMFGTNLKISIPSCQHTPEISQVYQLPILTEKNIS